MVQGMTQEQIDNRVAELKKEKGTFYQPDYEIEAWEVWRKGVGYAAEKEEQLLFTYFAKSNAEYMRDLLKKQTSKLVNSYDDYYEYWIESIIIWIVGGIYEIHKKDGITVVDID